MKIIRRVLKTIEEIYQVTTKILVTADFEVKFNKNDDTNKQKLFIFFTRLD